MICENCKKQFDEDWRKYKKGTPRFCSKACACSVAHRTTTKEVYCLSCGKSLGVGYRVKHRVYCSNSCQQKQQQADFLASWLKTGAIGTYTGGKAGNSSTSKAIRRFLLIEQKDTCSICGNIFFWQGKPLVPILDHKDGNFQNNNRENLRLICSNCDSQLSTYKARNKGNGRRAKGIMANKGL